MSVPNVPNAPQKSKLSDQLQYRFDKIMERLTKTEPEGVPSDIFDTVESTVESLINALDTFLDRMAIRSQKQRIFILQKEIDERNDLIDNCSINIKKRDENNSVTLNVGGGGNSGTLPTGNWADKITYNE